MADPHPDPDLDPAAGASSTAAPVDLASLDDTNLARYRHPNERRALVGIVVGLAIIIAALGLAQWFLGNLLDYLQSPVLHTLIHWFHPARIGPLLLIGIVAMWIMDVVGQSARAWQLVAQAVEVTPATFPQLAPIADELRRRFDLPHTRIYVSRDAPLTGYTIGVREPFAIVFSALGVGQLTPDEFKFVLGREMGSIKLGHTRMATLLGNVQMSLPQPFSFLLRFRSVLFGAYHHAQALSCDRIGVVATRDVKPALSTLIKQNLGAVRGAKIDVKSLAPQTAELNRGVSGATLRLAMLFNPKPWAVARLAELVTWAGEPAEAPAQTGGTPTADRPPAADRPATADRPPAVTPAT